MCISQSKPRAIYAQAYTNQLTSFKVGIPRLPGPVHPFWTHNSRPFLTVPVPRDLGLGQS